ncbi:drug/metabolite transporter (DMT)-like permease [Salinibacter ruber]|uniref:DMT family transporter n=1 Tax=Salinibacter ruber TaxID=146919 RepID=UPI002168B0DA|nr:DMT family transporter [Salinibacter ruber]MCS3634135.1 drug/metabolite transporter (DMT)-like permease [Salinibacter ruber]MCS3713625.1 drug/metabolite transporter (DMT)-like permease [Salinibacter ruber]
MSDWPRRIYVVLSLGVLSFAFAPILVRWAGDVPGLAIAVWRTVTAAAVLIPVAAARTAPELQRLTRRDVMLTGAAGVFLGLHFIAWIESLYHTTVASASVLVTTSPIILAALGYLFLGERLRRGTVLAIGIAVGGAGLIGWADAGTVVLGQGALLGNALALSGALLVSVYLLIGRVVRQKVSWLAYVTPLYAVAALTALATAVLRGVPLTGYSWSFYAVCAGLALGPQVLGHGSFNYALQRVPAALVGMLALLEPVGASLLAYGLFGEVPPPASIVGMVVVLAAVAVVVWRREARPEGAADPAPSGAVVREDEA